MSVIGNFMIAAILIAMSNIFCVALVKSETREGITLYWLLTTIFGYFAIVAARADFS